MSRLVYSRSFRAASRTIEKCFDPLADWSGVAEIVGGRELACSHYIPEEAPDALLAEIEQFFKRGEHGNA